MRPPRAFLIAALAALATTAPAAEAIAPLMVPVESVQAERLTALRDIYKDDYAKRKPDERSALARKLFDQGMATSDDPAARYVFLREAVDLAAKAGDLDTGLKALAALTTLYQLDAADEHLRFYAAVGPALTSLAAARQVIDGMLAIVERAVAADDYPLALRAATQADGFARRLKDAALPVRTRQALDSAKALASEYAALGDLRDLLGEFTSAGHTRYGRFLCLSKHDWERGLAHLAQGDDAPLRALATAETAATTPEARLACADGWYDWAQKQKAKVRLEGLAHASDIYRRLVPGLTGLTLARVDKRLGELDKLLGARSGPRYPDGAALLLTFEAGTLDGTTAWDLSPNRHQGRITGAIPAKGPWGTALQFDGVGAAVTVANHPSLQTVASSTLMMWLQPSQLGVRRNPWNKSYGAEGTWTLEVSGLISGYYGIAGADGTPYTQLDMTNPVVVGEWVHVAMVRDFTARAVTWYRNGAVVVSAAPAYATLLPSVADVSIGRGYAGAYAGLIDEVALWPRALTAAEVTAVYEATLSGRK